MNTGPWRYAVDIQREDRSPVRQVEVAPDWDPLCECLRLVALRQGVAPAEAFALECRLEPIWHRKRGEPYVEGIRVRAHANGDPGLSIDLKAECFASPAQSAITQLVEDGTLQEGDSVRYLPIAFARSGDVAKPGPTGRFKTQARPPELTVKERSLSALLAHSSGPLGSTDEIVNDTRVFIPQSVIDEAVALTRRVHGVFEIGGLLVGHLCRDVDGASVLVEVTGQIPARHVQASSARLTFTSDTWTEFRAALELRRRGEIMVGWWHSHPVREWCKNCAEERQRVCALRGDYFSADDRLLHRAMFPRAYTLALVVNDVAYDEPTLSMFGWRRASIELRGYHVLNPLPQEAPTAAHQGGRASCSTTT